MSSPVSLLSLARIVPAPTVLSASEIRGTGRGRRRRRGGRGGEQRDAVAPEALRARPAEGAAPPFATGGPFEPPQGVREGHARLGGFPHWGHYDTLSRGGAATAQEGSTTHTHTPYAALRCDGRCPIRPDFTLRTNVLEAVRSLSLPCVVVCMLVRPPFPQRKNNEYLLMFDDDEGPTAARLRRGMSLGGQAHNRPSSPFLSARLCPAHSRCLFCSPRRPCFVQTAIAVLMRSSLLRFQKMQRWVDRTCNASPAPTPPLFLPTQRIVAIQASRSLAFSFATPLFFSSQIDIQVSQPLLFETPPIS